MTEAAPIRLRYDRIALGVGLCLFAVSLLVRIVGITWGLPNADRTTSLHPDEPIIWMYSQQIEPAKLKFTPGFYNYGTLYLTILRVTTDVASAYGAGPKAEDGSDRDAAVGRFILAGRWVSALAGAGIGWVTFLILYRRTHLLGAVAAGLAASLAPGIVVHSRFQTVDVLATFFVILSLHFALKLAPPPGVERPLVSHALRTAGLAGLFAGLSAGTKYTGILALFALVVVAALEWRKRGETRGEAGKLIVTGVATALGAFVLTTPGILLDTANFFRDFKYEMTHTSTGHGLVFAGTTSGYLYHLGNLVVAYGLLMLPLSIAGFGRAVFRRYSWAIALGAFGLAYYLLIGRAEVKFLRYVFPLIPLLALGFGWMVGQAHLHPNRGWRILNVLGMIAFSGVIASRLGYGGGLTGSGLLTLQMAQVDVRDEAGAWLKERVDSSDSVGLVSDPWFYTPTLYPQANLPLAVPIEVREEIRQSVTDPRVVRYIPAEGLAARLDWDERLLTELRPDWVVFSSFEADDLARIAANDEARVDYESQVARFESLTKRLEAEYEIARIFGWDGPKVHDLMYIRPTLWIWKRKEAADSTNPSNGS